MELLDRIVVDKGVRFGCPVIRGTRVPVELIVGKLAGGMSYEDVMTEYEVTREDILAAGHLQVGRGKSGLLGNSCEHAGADLLAIMRREYEVEPADSLQSSM